MMDDFVADFGAQIKAAARKPRRRRPVLPAVAVAAVAAIVLVVVLVAGGGARERSVVTPPVSHGLVGQRAPYAIFPQVYGEPFAPSRFFEGGPTLVVFGSSRCAACVADLPNVDTARRDVEDAYGALLYVDVGERPRAFRALDVPAGIKPVVRSDRHGAYARKWHVGGTGPYAAVIDGHGKVVAVRPGPVDIDWLDEHLKPIVAAGQLAYEKTVALYAALRDQTNLVAAPPGMNLGTFSLGPASKVATHLVFEGRRYRFWVSISPAGMCTQQTDRGGGGGTGCGELHPDGPPIGELGYTAGGLIYGFLPDGISDVRVHFRHRPPLPVTLAPNAFIVHALGATSVTWRSADGKLVRNPVGTF